MDSLLVPFRLIDIDHVIQVVDPIKIDVGQVVQLRIKITGHGDIYQKKRSVTALTHKRFDVTVLQDDIRRTRGTDHDINLFKLRDQLVQ